MSVNCTVFTFSLKMMCVSERAVCILRNGRRRVTLHLSNHFKGCYVPEPVVDVGVIKLKRYKDKKEPLL